MSADCELEPQDAPDERNRNPALCAQRLHIELVQEVIETPHVTSAARQHVTCGILRQFQATMVCPELQREHSLAVIERVQVE